MPPPPSTAPTIPGNDSPEEIAQRVVRYIEIYVESGEKVRAEPERRASISAELQASGDEVPMTPGAVEDPKGALEYYDEFLARDPQSYKDHYLRFHYATSASILVSTQIITPRAHQDPTFFQSYSQAFPKLSKESEARRGLQQRTAASSPGSHSPPKAPPEPSQVRVSLDEAEGLLDNIRGLIAAKFYAFEGGTIEESGNWKVQNYTFGEDGNEEYLLRFEQVTTALPFDRGELLELLLKSIRL